MGKRKKSATPAPKTSSIASRDGGYRDLDNLQKSGATATVINETVTGVPNGESPSTAAPVPPPVDSGDKAFYADSDPKQAEEGATWSNLFRGSFTAKGAQLGFVPPKVVGDRPVAKLLDSEITKGNQLWDSSIVFYVIGSTPSLSAVYKYIASQWNQVGKPLVYLHDDGYFIVKFGSVDDKNSVLCSGPYMFYNKKPIVIKPWNPHFHFQHEVLRTVPLWVRFPNLALNCWSVDSLSRIGSLLGVPVCADSCTTRQLRISYARLLIEMDVTKALPKDVWIEGPNGIAYAQKVLYEWAPPFCTKCNMVGHKCGDTKKDGMGNRKKQWVTKAKSKPADPKPTPVEDLSTGPSIPQATPAGPVPFQTNQSSGTEQVGSQGNEIALVTPIAVVPPPASSDGDGWQTVARRTKDRARKATSTLSCSNSYLHLIEEEAEDQLDSGSEDEIPKGGGNPYLS